MKLKYDDQADAIYLTFKNGKVNKTLEVGENTLIDIDEKGKILGLEILDFSCKFSEKDLKTLEPIVK